MCFTTRTPSPPPSIRLASRSRRHSQASTLPVTIVTRSPSTATKRTSHRYSNSNNTFDTAISHSPRASPPSVTIETVRPTAVTPRIETARPTGYRRQIIFDDNAGPAAAIARRTPTTAATVASPRIPRSDRGAPPPAAPEPPPTSARRSPPVRQHRHTWSADLPLTTTKRAKGQGERSVRSAPEEREKRDVPRRITSGRSGRSDRLSGVVARQGGSERRVRSVSRDRGGEMVVVSRRRGKGFLGL